MITPGAFDVGDAVGGSAPDLVMLPAERVFRIAEGGCGQGEKEKEFLHVKPINCGWQ